MSKQIRIFSAAVAVMAVLVTGASPSLAGSSLTSADREASVPVVLDALILRPIGFSMTILGAVAYGLAAPIMAITRPTDMGKPFQQLVVAPARYTFVDPLGLHPPQ